MAIAKNISQLENLVSKKIYDAMKLTENIIFVEMKEWIDLYYSEYNPKYYRRTYKMSDSFKDSGIMKDNNGFYFQIGFDDDYLTFTYNTKSGFTGLNVLQAMESRTHGYTAVADNPHAHWTEGLNRINTKYGNISELFKTQLRNVGLNIL